MLNKLTISEHGIERCTAQKPTERFDHFALPQRMREDTNTVQSTKTLTMNYDIRTWMEGFCRDGQCVRLCVGCQGILFLVLFLDGLKDNVLFRRYI